PTSSMSAPVRGSAPKNWLRPAEAGANPYTEPEPGHLDGDVTAGERPEAFSHLDPALRPLDGRTAPCTRRHRLARFRCHARRTVDCSTNPRNSGTVPR